MPWYKNDKAGFLGLNHKGGAAPRVIEPGAIFEAEKSDIPEHYFAEKWIAEAQAPAGSVKVAAVDVPKTPPAPDSETAKTGSGQFTGPAPVQGSGTSVLESATDKEASESGAYTHDPKRRK
jgi:hypothetical protein